MVILLTFLLAMSVTAGAGGALYLISEHRRIRTAYEQNLRERTSLVRAAAHEVRQPLNGVVGLLGSIKTAAATQMPIRPEVTENLDLSLRDLSDALINTLEIFDLGTGELMLEPEPLDLRTEVLLQVRKVNLRLLNEKPGVVVETGFLPEFWCEADPIRLRQCIGVLIDQAVAQTDRGKVVVSARVEKVDGAGHRVTVLIKDQGRGMDQHRANHFFDPIGFAQNPALKGRPSAMLALNLVRQIAGLMGGSITASSRLGSGTSFFLNFQALSCPPLAFEDLYNQQTPEKAENEPGAVRFEALSVLLVDDNGVNLFVLQEFILPLGFCKVVCVESGQEAIDRAREEPFDLILMDLAMPEVDGYMASRAIKRGGASKEAPVIAVSAEHVKAGAPELVEAGIEGFVPKPIVSADLFSAILKVSPQMIEHARRRGVDVDRPVSADWSVAS